ncbi:hypothetical protein [Pyxidicoccus trucidator]|uniref:hypothetical protein n=1 Tax=Pyxidicoccus trucidator TaxID=2709662 RepID=UPI001F08240B|nr:hypothetical protein [Pyxidicoccus trucidator]
MWSFEGYPGSDSEPFFELKLLREFYVKARTDYTGRVTVPVLWDRQLETIVNNESRELLPMLDTEFDAYGDASMQLTPPHLRPQVDATLDAIYPSINNGVYRAGFASSQPSYAVGMVSAWARRWLTSSGRGPCWGGPAVTTSF